MKIEDCEKILKVGLFETEQRTYDALIGFLELRITEYSQILKGDNPEAKLKFANGKVVGVQDIIANLRSLKTQYEEENRSK